MDQLELLFINNGDATLAAIAVMLGVEFSVRVLTTVQEAIAAGCLPMVRGIVLIEAQLLPCLANAVRALGPRAPRFMVITAERRRATFQHAAAAGRAGAMGYVYAPEYTPRLRKAVQHVLRQACSGDFTSAASDEPTPPATSPALCEPAASEVPPVRRLPEGALDRALRAYEHWIVFETLRRSEWNVREAADKLHLHFQRLFEKVAILGIDLELEREKSRVAPCAPGPSPIAPSTLAEAMRVHRKGVVAEALERCRFNVPATARELGVSVRTVFSDRKKFEILTPSRTPSLSP